MGLGLSFRKGEDFYINDERFFVSEIRSPTAFCIVREKDGQAFWLAEGQAAELAPALRVSVGDRGQFHLARVSFDAPREVLITEGDKYRRNGGHRRP